MTEDERTKIRKRALEHLDGAMQAVRTDLTSNTRLTDADRWALSLLLESGEAIVSDVLALDAALTEAENKHLDWLMRDESRAEAAERRATEAEAAMESYADEALLEQARAETAERERDALQACLNHEEGYADAMLPKLTARADALEARLRYIVSEYECYCEIPGTTNDCPVCVCRAALVKKS